MNIREMRRNWDKFGKLDPLWAVLTEADKEGGKWDAEEFFATGRREIAEVMAQLASRNLPTRFDEALDFGCGVGRLTQALAAHFRHVAGVDISPSMIEHAQRLNRQGDRCSFHRNVSDDLRQFRDNTFDFVYSSITLQHIEPVFTRRYLREFLRVLAQDGILLFQLPSERTRATGGAHGPSGPGHVSFKQKLRTACPRVYSALFAAYYGGRNAGRALREKLHLRYRVLTNRPVIPMHGIERDEVVRLLSDEGGTLLDVSPDTSPGPDWISYRYCVAKRGR